MSSVDQLIARTLGIAPERVTPALEYQSIKEWDSLGHVSLMVALEKAYGVPVDDELTLELRTVAAIRAFAEADGHAAADTRARPAVSVASAASAASAGEHTTVHRGLEGVVFDRTSVTRIDGAEGSLEYRGYSIHDLAGRASFEEVAHLLVRGDLPDEPAREAFAKELRAQRELPRL